MANSFKRISLTVVVSVSVVDAVVVYESVSVVEYVVSYVEVSVAVLHSVLVTVYLNRVS
jgi:hypothetical protein